MKRGEIYFANMGPRQGSEQMGCRPVVIVSNDVGNERSTVVTVVPLGGIKRKFFACHVFIKKNRQNNLSKDSIAFCEQIVTIDKSRICSKRIGKIGDFYMELIEEKIQLALGMRKENINESDS